MQTVRWGVRCLLEGTTSELNRRGEEKLARGRLEATWCVGGSYSVRLEGEGRQGGLGGEAGRWEGSS